MGNSHFPDNKEKTSYLAGKRAYTTREAGSCYHWKSGNFSVAMAKLWKRFSSAIKSENNVGLIPGVSIDLNTFELCIVNMKVPPFWMPSPFDILFYDSVVLSKRLSIFQMNFTTDWIQIKSKVDTRLLKSIIDLIFSDVISLYFCNLSFDDSCLLNCFIKIKNQMA